MGEMTISMKDLMYRVCLRWRLVLTCLILGAVFLGGIGYKKNVNTAKQIEEKNSLTEEQMIEKYESELSEEEKAIVWATISDYKNSRDLENYYLNSIKMKLDPNKLPTIRHGYLIDNHYEAVYPVIEAKDYTNDILHSYAVEISSPTVYERVAKMLGDEEGVAYIGELISVDIEEEFRKWGQGDVLTIEINGPDEDSCKEISKVIKATIEAKTPELEKIYGDFDIILIHDQYLECVNTELLGEQRQLSGNYSTLTKNINNTVNGMTETQKNYYKALLQTREIEDTEFAQKEMANAEEPVDVKLFNIKYIILGAMAGVFAACFYIGFRYLLSSKLRVADDLEDYFGIPRLGILLLKKSEKKKRNFIDWKIRSIWERKYGQFSEEENIRVICAAIRIGAQRSKLKSVYLTGVSNDEMSESIKRLICDQLKTDMENVRCGKSVIYDLESLENMIAADGVVLIERVGASRYDELRREVDICRQNHIEVLGSVVLN